MADWTFVCNTSDVDFEDQYRFDHNGQTYCIYHLEDGFYATDGLCTHEDVHLVDGLIDGEEIECPMHLGVFNIKTGKVVMDPPCEDLKTYKIKVEDEKINFLWVVAYESPKKYVNRQSWFNTEKNYDKFWWYTCLENKIYRSNSTSY